MILNFLGQKKEMKNKILMFLIKIIIKSIGGEEMFNKLREFLSGKKTYLVCIGLIIEAVVEYSSDGDIGKLINKILVALGGISIRAGISKNGK